MIETRHVVIPDLLPRNRRLPARARISTGMPPEMREMMESLAQSLAGQHGSVFARPLTGMIRPLTATAESEAEGRWMTGMLVAAFIEIAGLDETAIADPFHAAFYRLSVKANHVRAATRYIRAQGGWQSYKAMLDSEMEKHPEFAEIPSPMVALPGYNIEPERPETPQESVTRIIKRASKMLETNGEVCPLLAVLDAAGKGVLFSMETTGTKAEIQQFFGAAEKAGRSIVPGASRFVRATEVWISESTEVRPSLSDQRREAVSIVLWDHDAGIAGSLTTVAIERDAEGRPRAGAIDHDIGEARRAGFDG